jgi:hypothetical protein
VELLYLEMLYWLIISYIIRKSERLWLFCERLLSLLGKFRTVFERLLLMCERIYVFIERIILPPEIFAIFLWINLKLSPTLVVFVRLLVWIYEIQAYISKIFYILMQVFFIGGQSNCRPVQQVSKIPINERGFYS